MRNPGPEHLTATDKVIAYLYRTKFLVIQYLNSTDYWDFDYKIFPLKIYFDAVFADNIDRKSLDGFLITLFGGLINWKALK